MRRLIVITLLGLGLMWPTTGARAASFLDRSYGTPEAGLSARARAMGGAGLALANGALGLADNPATLTLERGSRADLSGGLSRVSENRFVPLYDTFDSFVDEAAIAVNDHVYPSMTGGVAWDPGRWNGVMLAAGVLDRSDPRYDYYDERRTTATTDQIVAERFIRTRGVLRTLSFGAALPVFGSGSVGLAVHRWIGRLEHRDALVPHASGVSGRVDVLDRRVSGTSLGLGGTWRAGDRLTFAVAWEPAPRLHDDWTTWANDSLLSTAGSNADLRMPARLMFGSVYRPRNALRTTFAFDAVHTSWSAMRDPLYQETCLDTWDVRFGLEHVYYNNLPGRIGFRYARSYETREADRAAFTFGVGYRADRLSLDVSGEIAKRESRQTPLWPRDEQGPAVGAGMDRVEDTSLRLFVGARIGF